MSIKLKVNFLKEENTLRVNYSITNEGPTPVYVLNVLWQFNPEGKPVLDPHLAYRSLHADGTLRLGKIIHPLPKEQFVEVAILPFARPLPGQSLLEETFAIPLPVVEYNPYYPEDDSAAWQDVTTKAVELWVSWAPKDPQLVVHDNPLGVGVRLDHPTLLKLVQTLQSPPTPLTVNAKKRTDPFERF